MLRDTTVMFYQHELEDALTLESDAVSLRSLKPERACWFQSINATLKQLSHDSYCMIEYFVSCAFKPTSAGVKPALWSVREVLHHKSLISKSTQTYHSLSASSSSYQRPLILWSRSLLRDLSTFVSLCWEWLWADGPSVLVSFSQMSHGEREQHDWGFGKGKLSGNWWSGLLLLLTLSSFVHGGLTKLTWLFASWDAHAAADCVCMFNWCFTNKHLELISS